jgi:hypothetical protein
MFTQNASKPATLTSAQALSIPQKPPESASKSAKKAQFHQIFYHLREEFFESREFYPQLYPCYTPLFRSYTVVLRVYAVFIPNLLDTFLPSPAESIHFAHPRIVLKSRQSPKADFVFLCYPYGGTKGSDDLCGKLMPLSSYSAH